jgi:hypothetical protein
LNGLKVVLEFDVAKLLNTISVADPYYIAPPVPGYVPVAAVVFVINSYF